MRPSPPADAQDPADAARLDAEFLAGWPLPLDEHGDKTVRGTVLVIAGATGTAGAAVLSGIAALRMGAGRLQIATAEPVAIAMSMAVPEALIIPLAVDSDGTPLPSAAAALESNVASVQAVLIGPGLSAGAGVEALVRMVAMHTDPTAVVVLDAAALTALEALGDPAARRLAGRLVLTPNRQELDAMRGDPQDGVKDSVVVARRYGAVVSSFGRVDAPDSRSWMSTADTPGLGTSGSGDVLAGLAVGAAARSGDAAQAACWATHVHAEAGCRLSDRGGRVSFIARELLEEAPSVLGDVERITARRSRV